MNYEKTIVLRLTKGDYEKVKAEADSKKINVSELLRRLIKQGV